MADKNLTCKDCGTEFVFTEGEQAFYKEKGFENEPQRCPDCRKAKQRLQKIILRKRECCCYLISGQRYSFFIFCRFSLYAGSFYLLEVYGNVILT